MSNSRRGSESQLIVIQETDFVEKLMILAQLISILPSMYGFRIIVN